MLVFDFDGTLVDTRDAVRRAYLYAGVRMPDDAWERPWYEWTTAACHRRKNDWYARAVQDHARVLPLLNVARDQKIPVITGASFEGISTVLNWFGYVLDVRLCSASLYDKIVWLCAREPGTYVDDSPRVREAIAKETRWNVISPEECARSFSPRVPTSG